MPVALDGEQLDPVALIEQLEALGAQLRHRPRHPPRRHDHRHQGPRRVRGAGRRGADHRAPRAREAGAHRPPAAREGDAVGAVYGDSCTRASTSTRCAATSRRCSPRRRQRVTGEVSVQLRPGSAVRRWRDLAALADGRRRRRLRRSGRRMDGRGRARLLEDLALPGMFYTRAGRADGDGGTMRYGAVVDKIASVARRCGSRARRCASTADIPCEEGVRGRRRGAEQQVDATTRSSSPAAAWPRSSKGDVVAGALGHRQALFGYSGHLPTAARAGRHRAPAESSAACSASATRSTRRHGPAVRLRGARRACCDFPYLGERIGVPARVGDRAAGPRRAARHARRAGRRARRHVHERGQDGGRLRDREPLPARGLVVDAFKSTGVSLRRDILAMEDAGRAARAMFTDFGIVRDHVEERARRSRARC